MSLLDYINNFRQELEKLEDYGYAESVEIREETRVHTQAVITACILLVNGSSLHIKEYIDARYKIDRVSYAYHYQDIEGKCIFRYDNAAHRPPLEFKEHKHIKNVDVIEASLPPISELVNEVIEHL